MVRFGIVGFGLHAVRRLMPGFAKARKCTVTALSRSTMEKARASAAEYDIPLAFDSAVGFVPFARGGCGPGDDPERIAPGRRFDCFC